MNCCRGKAGPSRTGRYSTARTLFRLPHDARGKAGEATKSILADEVRHGSVEGVFDPSNIFSVGK
jgi:hypothetical protein